MARVEKPWLFFLSLMDLPVQAEVVDQVGAGDQADKPLAFLNDAHEDNPALGLRGLRALRASEDILREQLTALANADKATEADLWVMAPMVSTVEETQYFVTIAKEYGIKTAGVMIEVPGAALRTEHVLRDCDFGSLGTNDLSQYTMAADRMATPLVHLTDPWQPAVLQLVSVTAAAGQRAGKPVALVNLGPTRADPKAQWRWRAPVSEALAWLEAHRTAAGALPEKVLADGAPAGPAPLAWTCALILLATASRAETPPS